MTAVPGTRAASDRPDGSVPSGREGRDVPSRADGVQLIGELEGSGYRTPPALVRRADGQTIQLTKLLYLVLQAVDGARDLEDIALEVSRTSGRQVGGEDVRTLVDGKLRPLGVLSRPDGEQPEVRRSNPLLALRFRYVVTDPDRTRRLTAPFALLFRPAVAVLFTLAFVAVSAWVLFREGLAAATYDAFDRPGLLLLVFAITVVSAGFHEFGHAAACRYGGATPGVMGAGLYLVWPAFYTEVSDSYRLGRGGRLRVDVGGLYFNAIVAVGMYAVWALSGWDALLLVIATQLLQMLRQLAPLVRFDGYHILADTVGVPDLYSHIKPTLLGLLPTRWGKPQHTVLKTWARAVVSVWVLLVVPLLLLTLVLIVVTLPRVLATAWAGLTRQQAFLAAQWSDRDVLGTGAALLSMLAIVLTVAAMIYILARVARRSAVGTWKKTEGRPVQRSLAGVLAAALVAGLVWAWWPSDETYRPIQPTERGTLIDGIAAAGVTSLAQPSGLRDGLTATAPSSIWGAADAGELPTEDRPALALVLVPRDGGTTGAASTEDAPTWVFPFNRPGAPGEGDNQALAVNTADGSTVYDVAFALVWVTGEAVTNTNEAYAFASCTSCTTVAVGFQVVLALGQADVVIPQNLAGAVNYSCVECVTYALAQQLVVTLPGGLGPAATAEIESIWAEVAAFGAGIEDVPLGEIQARLAQFEQRILEALEDSDGATGSGRDDASAPASTPTTTGSPTSDSTTGGSESTGGPTGGGAEESGGADDSSTGSGQSPTSESEPSPTGTGTGTSSTTPSSTSSPAATP